MFDGEKVKARRLVLGLTQGDVAELIGIRQGTVAKIEGGKRISLTMAKRVACALRCMIDDLL